MIAGLEHLDVRLGECRVLGELLVDASDLLLGLAAVHPEHQAECEEVLRARLLLRRQLGAIERGVGELRDVDCVELVLTEAPVVDRVTRVAGLLEVGFDERSGVHDQRATVDKIPQVGLERSGIHRDQHVGRVAWRVDLGGREVQLESRHAEQAAGRSADLGREVRERRDVVAGLGSCLGELTSGELHAVAGVARKANHDPVQMLGFHRDYLYSMPRAARVRRTLPARPPKPKADPVGCGRMRTGTTVVVGILLAVAAAPVAAAPANQPQRPLEVIAVASRSSPSAWSGMDKYLAGIAGAAAPHGEAIMWKAIDGGLGVPGLGGLEPNAPVYAITPYDGQNHGVVLVTRSMDASRLANSATGLAIEARGKWVTIGAKPLVDIVSGWAMWTLVANPPPPGVQITVYPASLLARYQNGLAAARTSFAQAPTHGVAGRPVRRVAGGVRRRGARAAHARRQTRPRLARSCGDSTRRYCARQVGRRAVAERLRAGEQPAGGHDRDGRTPDART